MSRVVVYKAVSDLEIDYRWLAIRIERGGRLDAGCAGPSEEIARSRLDRELGAVTPTEAYAEPAQGADDLV